MDKKKLLGIAAVVCVAGFCIFGLVNKKDNNIDNDNTAVNITVNTHKENSKGEEIVGNKKENLKKVKDLKENTVDSSLENKDKIIKANLYNDVPSSALPLSAVVEISNLPENIKQAVAKIAETKNIYMIQRKHDKLLIVTDNPANIRHNIEFTEISLKTGHQIHTTFGYNDKINDSNNDIWAYNEETKQPIRHTKYNSEGDVDFVEVWNYEPDAQVKYEMKDSEGRVISMRKESLQGGTDLRVEHLLYDKEGNTKINVSASYDGQDIKRFTYYNADKPESGGVVISDYSDGLKTKEVLYTPDLKVKNTYTAEYKDGNREEIIMWNSANEELEKLVPDESL